MRFDKQSNIAKKKKVTYPNLVLAFKLLDNSGLSEVDRKFVLSEMDFSKEDDVYEDTKKALVKYKSESVCSKNANSVKSECEIKVEESAMITNSADGIGGLEKALVAAGWSKPRYNSTPDRGNSGWNGHGRSNDGRFNSSYNKYPSKNNDAGQHQQYGKNPKKNGEHLRCFTCDSIFHIRNQCPHRQEYNRNNNNNTLNNTMLTEVTTLANKAAACAKGDINKAFCATEDVILYTGNNKDEQSTLCQESVKCALLDSTCTSNVCGSGWLDTLLATFDSEQTGLIEVKKGWTKFKFGGGEFLASMKSVTFPCVIAGHMCKITTDVVNSSIPLLISVGSMKKLHMLWDLAKDRAHILGCWTELI